MMKTKTYNQKDYYKLNQIVDELDTDNIKKKYNIKNILKGYIDEIHKEWKISNNFIKPTNNLHLMYELCSSYLIQKEMYSNRCDFHKINNDMLHEENERLKNELAELKEKYKVEKKPLFNVLNLDYD